MISLYTPTNPTDPESALIAAASIVGDASFHSPIMETAKVQSFHGSKAFLYLLSYRPVNSPEPEWFGVGHNQTNQVSFPFHL